jgi:lysophospholipase L1-like esterase
MSGISKIILIGSILLNLLLILGFYYYFVQGGSPLSDLKRRLTGTYRQSPPSVSFEEDNRRIVAELANGKTDSQSVVFLGASITQGWDLPRYFPEIHPINRGIGGFVDDLMVNYKSNVLDLKPRAVVIKFCSINIRPQIPVRHLKDAMQMMVELARAEGITPVVATVIPVGKPAARIGDFSVADTLAAFNEWVRSYAGANGLALIDYARAIQDEEGLLPRDCSIDPVHINEKGYDIIAGAARPVIYNLLGIKQK